MFKFGKNLCKECDRIFAEWGDEIKITSELCQEIDRLNDCNKKLLEENAALTNTITHLLAKGHGKSEMDLS